MQGVPSSAGSQPSNAFASALASSHSLITPRRVGFCLAGAFVFAGAAAMTGNAGSSAADTSAHQINLQSADTATPESNPSASQPEASGNPAQDGSSSSTNATNVQVNVNGQSVNVPQNGSVQQTVPTTDGTGQSSVNINSSNNSSGSSLNVNISSNSSSSGNGVSSSSTVVTQNGGTTFVSNN